MVVEVPPSLKRLFVQIKQQLADGGADGEK